MQSNHSLASTKIDLIGSDASIQTTDTDVLFKLKQTIEIPDDSYAMLALQSFNMIYATYLIREGINDSLTITTTSASGTVSYEITIPEGHYLDSEFVTTINALISTNLLSLRLDSLALTIQDNKHIMQFTASYSTYTLTEITFESTAYVQLGLSSGVSTYTSASGLFPKMYNLQNDSCFYVRIPNLTMTTQNSKGISGIIASVPVYVVTGDMIYYEIPSEPIFSRIVSHEISEIRVQILDENMSPIGNLLTNTSFRISLIVHFAKIRRANNIIFPRKELFNNHNIHNQIKDNASTTQKSNQTISQKGSRSNEAEGDKTN
jgi:hypothetical protein